LMPMFGAPDEGYTSGAELAGWKGGARPTLSFGRLA
jgi:hypothetical protein